MLKVARQRTTGKASAADSSQEPERPEEFPHSTMRPQPPANRIGDGQEHRDTNGSPEFVMHGREHEASPVALAASLVADGFPGSAARLAADALRWIADDLLILQAARGSENQIADDVLDMAEHRLELRARALSEVVRRIERDGTLDPAGSRS